MLKIQLKSMIRIGKKVEDFIKKDLPKSALEQVKNIYAIC